jgi:hypothetical protein
MRIVLLALLCVSLLTSRAQTPPTPTAPKSNYRVQEFMVPMRDGVHLQTVVITKANQTQPLPILLTRTPYGVLTLKTSTNTRKKTAPTGSRIVGRNSPPTDTSLSGKISVADSNPKAPFSSPRNTTPRIRSNRTKPTMPTTPWTGSSKTSPTTTAGWASMESPTTGSQQP